MSTSIDTSILVAATGLVLTTSLALLIGTGVISLPPSASHDEKAQEPQSQSSASTSSRRRRVVLELSSLELEYLNKNEQPRACISWFKGGSAQEAADLLHRRMHKIIQLNPWLNGRIKTQRVTTSTNDCSKDGNKDDIPKNVIACSKSTPCLVYRADTTVTADSLTLLSHVAYQSGTPLSQVDKVSKHDKHDLWLTQNGPKEPLWRVTVVPCKDTNEYGVIVSISQVVADATTFYKIHRMLCGATPVITAVGPERRELVTITKTNKVPTAPLQVKDMPSMTESDCSSVASFY